MLVCLKEGKQCVLKEAAAIGPDNVAPGSVDPPLPSCPSGDKGADSLSSSSEQSGKNASIALNCIHLDEMKIRVGCEL